DRQPAPVAVPRLPQAGGGHHATGAYHLPLLVFQHEEIVGIGNGQLAGKAGSHRMQTALETLLAGRQAGQAGTGFHGQAKQPGQRAPACQAPPISLRLSPSVTFSNCASIGSSTTGAPGAHCSGCRQARNSRTRSLAINQVPVAGNGSPIRTVATWLQRTVVNSAV